MIDFAIRVYLILWHWLISNMNRREALQSVSVSAITLAIGANSFSQTNNNNQKMKKISGRKQELQNCGLLITQSYGDHWEVVYPQ